MKEILGKMFKLSALDPLFSILIYVRSVRTILSPASSGRSGVLG